MLRSSAVSNTLRSVVRAPRAMHTKLSASHTHATAARAISTAVCAASQQVTYDSLNANLKKAEYAVRGKIVIKAMELQEELEKGGSGLPFDSMVFCNIGNPQSLRQKPITFHRQVLALLEWPDLMELPEAGKLFPSDAIARAKVILGSMKHGLGAYSESQGVKGIRQTVADFITARDGHAADADNIFLTDGASPAVQMTIRSLIRDENDAFMIPKPQYPLYSASIALFGGSAVSYELDESDAWGLTVAELEKQYSAAAAEGKNIRGLAVINPGNPTGNCLTRENMEAVISFCLEKNIMLMADEVYQENTWLPDRPFHSFKKVASDMGAFDSGLQLGSYHSVSKGFLGECGKRGGYAEFVGLPKKVKDELYKLVSISLCPNLAGQAMIDLMVNPPKEGDESYPTYQREVEDILSSMKRRAEKIVAGLNELEGVTCLAAQGAMYVFPQITLPGKAKQAAAEDAAKAAVEAGGDPEEAAANAAADAFYCMELLKATGIVVVPGSGFGQKDGTYHFRATILPPEDQMDAVIERITSFHAAFMDKYRD